MRVEFFEGRRSGQACTANTDDSVGIAVIKIRNGGLFSIDRCMADTVITNDAVRAVEAFWTAELAMIPRTLKHRPALMSCSAPNPDYDAAHDSLYITCGKDREDAWKQFLVELLSRPESWRRAPWAWPWEDRPSVAA